MKSVHFLDHRVFCGLEQGCLIGGLWDLLAFRHQPFMLVSLLPFPPLTKHPSFNHLALTQSPLLWTELPHAEKSSESAGLRVTLLSLSSVHVLALSRLLSSFLHLCRIQAMPVQCWWAARLSITTLPFSCLRQSRTYRELESKGHFLCWRCLLICKYDQGWLFLGRGWVFPCFCFEVGQLHSVNNPSWRQAAGDCSLTPLGRPGLC